MTEQAPLGWIGIVRLGLVQSAIGAIVMLSTSLLNRLMVVEYATPAAIPAGLVAWHYAVQLSRPLWGHGSDRGRRRTPWIVLGMAVLAAGSMTAVVATTQMGSARLAGVLLALVGFSMIGAGVGAAGTSLLALLAARVAPERRAAAASLTWIMMIVGIVMTAGIAGRMLDPFSTTRLFAVAAGVTLGACLLTLAAVHGIEGDGAGHVETDSGHKAMSFPDACVALWADARARRFTIFVFVSMLAYSMQDMILEPFAGLMFGFTPAQSTSLSGLQHSGVLAGMVLVGVAGSAFGRRRPKGLRIWTVSGCLGSAMALVGLALAARAAPHWPIAANIALLGFFNGMFAVAAIGSMMALAGDAAEPGQEGIRMGVWGAAQALAFGAGGLTGAVGVDLFRAASATTASAFASVFGIEALLFLCSAWIATVAVSNGRSPAQREAFA